MKVQLKRQINASAAAIWSYLSDYANIHRFHPLLKGSQFIEGTQSCEVGSTRQCDMKDGNYIKERVTHWEPGSHYTVDIYDTSMPIKDAKATLGVRPLGDQRSEAYMHIEMTPKYRLMQPILFLMFRFIAAPSILNGLAKLHRNEQQLAAA